MPHLPDFDNHLCLSPAFGQESTTTIWKGTLDARGRMLRLEVEIVERLGKLTGQLRSLDQGDATFPATDIKFDAETIRFSIPRINAKFNGNVAGDGERVEGTFSQSGVDLPLTLSKSDEPTAVPQAASQGQLQEAWIGKLEIGVIEPVMQFRIVKTESGETAAYFDSITEGRTNFEATWSIEGDTLKFDVATIKLTYRGQLNAVRDTAKGTWSQGGRDVPLTLKKQSTEYDNVNVWKNRPQRPVAPFPYDAEDVTFENQIDDVTLAGTLTIPNTTGRHPAVVLISGSGPQDRDESLMEHKPFLVLADYLTRRGIAVLRYDDRGTAASTGTFDDATTEDFAHDAVAAVEFLEQHDRINPRYIGLAGHSEGGLVAPMVVGLRDEIAFVVLLAATGVDGATIVQSQTEAMLRAAGTEEAEIKLALAVNQKAVEVAMNARPGDDFAQQLDEAIESVIETIPASERKEASEQIRQAIDSQKQRLQGEWMRFFLRYDPRPALTNIKCPLLALTGSKDLQVLPKLNLPEIKKALAEAGNKDVEFVELDGLNHLFQFCETGEISEYATISETFNPRALEIIGDWIVKQTTQDN